MNALTKFCAGAAVALATATALPASASTFMFSFTDLDGNSANGTFVTSGSGATQTITSISGLFDGAQITMLSPYAGSDQLLLTTSTPNFDFAGISFSVTNHPDYNLCACGDSLGDVIDSASNPGGGGSTADPILTFTLTSVPEPLTWAMMALGIGLLGAGLRLGRAKPEFAAA